MKKKNFEQKLKLKLKCFIWLKCLRQSNNAQESHKRMKTVFFLYLSIYLNDITNAWMTMTMESRKTIAKKIKT